MSEIAEKPLRADARRNREKVLEAAKAAFAEEGLDAQMPEIARRAGVGVGTIYRSFPTKDAMIAAITDLHFEQIGALARTALDQEGDPWEVFEELMWSSARMCVQDRGLAEVAANRPEAMGAAAREHRMFELFGELITRGQRAGRIRADASADDVSTIMCGLGRIASLQMAGQSPSWDRYMTLMLDGLRAR